MSEGLHHCLVCGEPTLDERPPGTHQICRNCGWQDDIGGDDADKISGANGCTMREHRRSELEEAAVQAYWGAGHQHGRPRTEIRLPDGSSLDLDGGAAWYGEQVDAGLRVQHHSTVLDSAVTVWMSYRVD